jgi:hypothetical protein
MLLPSNIQTIYMSVNTFPLLNKNVPSFLTVIVTILDITETERAGRLALLQHP